MDMSTRTRLEISAGDKHDHEFAAFLDQLIGSGKVEGAALGIFKLVRSQGDGVLTERQKAIFYGVMNNFIHDKCEICSQKIPWSEMYAAINQLTLTQDGSPFVLW